MKLASRLPPVLILLLLTLTAGCQKKADDSDIKVDLKVEPSPPKVGMAKVTLDVKDSAGKPVEGAALKLEGNMSHAGMKPVFADAKEEKAGRYLADLEFTMSGDWFIVVEGKLDSGKKFTRKIDVKGVRAD